MPPRSSDPPPPGSIRSMFTNANRWCSSSYVRNAIAGSWYWTFAPNTVWYHASISSKRRLRYATCTNFDGRTVMTVALLGRAKARPSLNAEPCSSPGTAPRWRRAGDGRAGRTLLFSSSSRRFLGREGTCTPVSYTHLRAHEADETVDNGC